MSDCLVIAESWGGRLRKATLSAVAAARQARSVVGGGFTLLVLGPRAAEFARELTGYGADRVLHCEHPALEHYVAEQYAPTVAAVARGFGLVLAAASSFGKDLVPRVAARLGAAYAADCSALRGQGGQLVFERPMYAGNVLGTCTLGTAIQTATIRQSEFPVAEPVPGGAPSPLEAVPFAPPGEAAGRVEFLSFAEIKSERPELGDARAVVSGGRPLKERFFALLDPLATELGAAIGATRAACDSGYAPGDYQVGQTGKVVAPELYVAVGISGALQHVAGMRGSRVVVAINRDPEAPIFQVADYGLVADLFEAVPELTRALAERKQQA
jgi:electron transfer flavoprotein alpha subunit